MKKEQMIKQDVQRLKEFFGPNADVKELEKIAKNLLERDLEKIKNENKGDN